MSSLLHKLAARCNRSEAEVVNEGPSERAEQKQLPAGWTTSRRGLIPLVSFPAAPLSLRLIVISPACVIGLHNQMTVTTSKLAARCWAASVDHMLLKYAARVRRKIFTVTFFIRMIQQRLKRTMGWLYVSPRGRSRVSSQGGRLSYSPPLHSPPPLTYPSLPQSHGPESSSLLEGLGQ